MFVICYVTVPNQETAKEIAIKLVDEKIVACVNIVPNIFSVYRWESRICEDPESLMIIKTRECLCQKLEERIKSYHPYTVPEFITLPIDKISESYKNWLLESTIES